MKLHISTTYHKILRTLAFLLVAAVIILLVYSLFIQDKDTIIFCGIYLIWSTILYNRILTPAEKVDFDEEYIYTQSHDKPIPFTCVTSIRRGKVKFQAGNVRGRVRLPNFYFWDENYGKLKQFYRQQAGTAPEAQKC